MLSLRLPLAGRACRSKRTGDDFVPNGISSGSEPMARSMSIDHAVCRNGSRHLHPPSPMLIAEELEVDLSQVRLEHAPPDEKRYGNPLLGGLQATGNSNAVRASWQPLRQAGATARTMLIAAAAQRWNVDPVSCRAQSGEVLHVPTTRRVKYGELAAMPPDSDSGQCRAQAAGRLQAHRHAGQATGHAGEGQRHSRLWHRCPAIGREDRHTRASPVFGGRVKSVDDTAARAVNGVRQIVRLEDVVAVGGRPYGAAKKGLAALVIEWDDGRHAKLTTKDIVDELEQAHSQPGSGCADHR